VLELLRVHAEVLADLHGAGGLDLERGLTLLASDDEGRYRGAGYGYEQQQEHEQVRGYLLDDHCH
jgi:hypothetical protein